MIKGKIYLTGFGETRFMASVYILSRWCCTEASYKTAEGAKKAMRELVNAVVKYPWLRRIKWSEGE